MLTKCEIIDISEHNVRCGAIDWSAVKASGIKGVLIRIGWAGYNGPIAGNNAIDDSFDTSIRGAAAAGLDIGLYVFSYTKSPAAARVAARECVSIAQKYPKIINMPIAFDVEFDGRKYDKNGKIIGWPDGWDCLIGQGATGLAQTIKSFCDEVISLKYRPMWYSYTSYILQYIDANILKGYDLWLADYCNSNATAARLIGRDNWTIRQYAGDSGSYYDDTGASRKSGKCPGVTGACDRNRCYIDYPLDIAQRFQNGLFYNPLTGGQE